MTPPPPPPPPTPATLPPEIETLLDVCVRTSMNYRTTGQSPERERYDAARVALESAITAALASAEERARRAEGERDEARSRLSDMLIGWSSPEDVTETTRRHLADLAALRAERDALAAALRRLVQAFDGGYWTACAAAMKNARAALATPSSPRTAGDDHAE
jgi:hypothetical protein